MKIKPVFRWDEVSLYRLFRLMWTRGKVGDGRGYSCKLSFALSTRPSVQLIRAPRRWVLYLIFLRIAFQRDFGGIHV